MVTLWTNLVDFSQDGGEMKVRQHLRDDELIKYPENVWKKQVVKYVHFHLLVVRPAFDTAESVWRPLVPVVENGPIAFCHPESVEPTDLVEKDNVSSQLTSVGSLYALHQPRHRWYYIKQQK